MDDQLRRYRPYIAMLLLFGLVLAGTIFILRRPEPAPIVITTPTVRPSPTVATIIVDVRGAVNKPGVYSLPSGSRVQDVLALAGDLVSQADTRNLYLARKLNDGERLYIPLVEVPPTVPAATARAGMATRTPIPQTTMGKININTATLTELDTLPGIGASIGQRIIDDHTQNGNFTKIDDLKKARGTGDARFEQIEDLITVQ